MTVANAKVGGLLDRPSRVHSLRLGNEIVQRHSFTSPNAKISGDASIPRRKLRLLDFHPAFVVLGLEQRRQKHFALVFIWVKGAIAGYWHREKRDGGDLLRAARSQSSTINGYARSIAIVIHASSGRQREKRGLRRRHAPLLLPHGKTDQHANFPVRLRKGLQRDSPSALRDPIFFCDEFFQSPVHRLNLQIIRA